MADGKHQIPGVSVARSADALRVTSTTPLRVLGSANIGDDLALTRNIVAMPADAEADEPTTEQQLHNWAIHAGIHEPYVGILTTAAVVDCVEVAEATANWTAIVLLFADIAALCSAGTTPPVEAKSGGIDIIILTDASLSMGAMVSAITTATEAKVRALAENSLMTAAGFPATGGASDSVVIACLSKGERIHQAGPTTGLGFTVAKLVHQALLSAVAR